MTPGNAIPSAVDIILAHARRERWKNRWLTIGEMPFSIRQSSLRTYHNCKRKAFYSLVAGEKGGLRPAYFIIGSMVHYVLESMLKHGSRPTPATLELKLDELRAEDEYDLDMTNTEFVARMFDTDAFYGMSLMDICNMIVVWLEAGGYEVKVSEKRWDVVVGNVAFQGTIDVLATRNIDGRVYNIIADFKAGGIADRFLGKGSCKAVSYRDEEVTQSNQLQMYDWAMYRLHGAKAHRYAYITPVNLVPNATGKNKGKPRGDLMFDQPAVTLDQLLSYEDDLFAMVKEIEYSRIHNSWPRLRPEVFGKLDCLRCPHKVACLGIRELNTGGADVGTGGVAHTNLPPHLRGVTLT